MLKNKKKSLQSLIIISLSSYTCHVNALDTVQSYENSLAQNISTMAEVNSGGNNQANYDLNQLSTELEKRGWKVNKENDGTLILKPDIAAKKTNKENSQNDQWQQVKQKFSDSGWDVVRDTDGSIRLYPQQKQTTASDTKEQDLESKTTINIENNSLISADMKKQLKAIGWGISSDSDGSVSLYPPAKKNQNKAIVSAACNGTISTININLPVDTWQEAHDIAQKWLQDNAMNDASVGKIRKIINVYIISIVARTSPHKLQHQVAIKNHDGALILLN